MIRYFVAIGGAAAYAHSVRRQHYSAVVFTGADWAVAVHTPRGWHAVCCSDSSGEPNLTLYRDSVGSTSDSAAIRIVVARKVDENTDADLQADMEEYRREYPDIRLDHLSVSHPHYRVLARVFTVPGRFYEYVTYINPGPSLSHLVSIAFNKQRVAATAEELVAYREVVASVVVLR